MKRLICIYIFFFTFSAGFAQETQRAEMQARQLSDDYQVVTMGKYGAIVFDFEDKLLSSTTPISFTGYDHDLNETWQKQVDLVKSSYTFRGSDVDEERLYLLFSRFNSPLYYVVEVNAATQQINVHEVYSLKKLSFTDFKVLEGKIFLTGEGKRVPVLLHMNLEEKGAKKVNVLPTSFNKKTEVDNLEKDTVNQVVNLTATYWKGRNSHLVLHSFYPDGEPAQEPIQLEDRDKNLLTAKRFITGFQQSMIIGTFSNNRSELADGLFVAGHNGYDLSYIKYHSFAELENFLSYLSDRKQENLKEKQKRKKDKGKDLNMNYRLLIHDLIHRADGQFTMVAEAYYPVYRSERRRFYSGYGYYTDWVRVFAGYRYTHAMVAGFSEEGDLLWDHSFELEYELYPRLQPLVKVGFRDKGELKLSYSYEGEIHSKLVRGSEILESEALAQIGTDYQGDRVKRSTRDKLEYWYDNYFLAYGFQKIKNQGEAEVKSKRNVFYLNKVPF